MKIKDVLNTIPAPAYYIDVENLRKKADDYLNHISIRRYIGTLSIENLVEMTKVNENPLFCGMSTTEFNKWCVKQNKIYRKRYNVSSLFDKQESTRICNPEIKEWLIWAAIMPAKRPSKILSSNCLFPLSGCQLGDELPIGMAVYVVNALLYLKFINEGETETAKKLIA